MHHNNRKRRLWVIVGFVLAWLPCGIGLGRQWTVGNRQVEATLTDFDGQKVVLKLANGKAQAIPLAALSDADAAHLRTLLELKAMGQQPAQPVPAPQNANPAVVGGQAQALQTLVSEAQYSRYLQQQGLQLQAAMFWRPWFDLWVVQFASPSGEPFWVMTAARDSDQATWNACRMYPRAELLWVVKFHRISY